MEDMPHGEPTIFDKPERFRGHYQSQIENYHQNIENVFSSTGYTFAERFNKKPTALGMQAETEGLCKFGVVFINAVKEDDSPLNSRQKNIIEAHEKGHALRDFHAPKDIADFQKSIDHDELDRAVKEYGAFNSDPEKRMRPMYIINPQEICERMAQLKNYFGMKANEIFTEEHLKYARANYINDTGLDNGMTVFFRIITPQVEKNFIHTINTYPI
jgi:hypothetical protein